MQLAITILAKKSSASIADILASVNTNKCRILEFSLSDFSHSVTAAYLLVEGNWNGLAKLETVLENLQKRLEVKICTLHVEPQKLACEYIPYGLEVIAIDQDDILQNIVAFLSTHHVVIENIKVCCFPDSYTQTPLFSSSFVLLVPLDVQLMSFREEIFNFCDDCNLDAIFEAIKR